MTRRTLAGVLATFLTAGAIGAGIVLSGCSTAQVQSAASSPAGQLFCAIATANGGQVLTAVQQVVDTAASALGPLGTVLAVTVTGQAASYVQSACSAAAAATGAVSGVPVSPPTSGTPTVVTVPASKISA